MIEQSGTSESTAARQAPSPPRIIAVSGLIFSGLFSATVVLLRLAVPADPADPGSWLADADRRDGVKTALNLIPITGIVFLWYMGVLRNRIGMKEDRFFATVFLGSGILFVAMLFVSAALSQAILAAFGEGGRSPERSETYFVLRRATHALLTTFALKMAAVFMFVTSMIGYRTKVLSRWVSLVGFGIALIFLLVLRDVPWIALLFPGWVMLVSTWILFAEFRRRHHQTDAS